MHTHGSVSKEQRAIIEGRPQSRTNTGGGLLRAAFELGIDMGAVDLVIQVEAPPSVAIALQRPDAQGTKWVVSRAAIFPKHRGDLLACTVVAMQMEQRHLESTRIPRNPSTFSRNRSSRW